MSHKLYSWRLLALDYVFLLISVTFAFSFGTGFLLEKYLRMPWMFSALFLGIILSSLNLFHLTLQDETFNVLSTMGMLFLLFMIGFNLEIGQMKRFGTHILKGAILIVGLEATIVGALLFFMFPDQIGNSPLVAIVVALSFATVGEAVLLPILAKFNLLKTNFGQLTLGIGTLDDILEVLTLIMIPFLPIFLPSLNIQGFPDPVFVIIDLIGIFILTIILVKIASRVKHVLSNNLHFSFIRPLLIMLIFFSFVVVGGFVFESLAAISAIFGGIVARNMLPTENFQSDEKVVNFLGYIVLSPMFFLSVGASMSFESILVYPILIIVILISTIGSKLSGSFLLFRKLLGKKQSLLLGLGLSVRFSTGLIVQYVLLISGLITLDLYSGLIASAVVMTPIILVMLPWALCREKDGLCNRSYGIKS
ncbi:cation:proton antiporter [Candidatus Bathyarchaeota archaeon]|nr:cation:proton antiporter [Candidatus Bathyarchaeota archaeon]